MSDRGGPSGLGSVHLPVLLDEVLEFLKPRSGGIYVDGNLGLGGHAGAVLRRSGPAGRLIGLDWDDRALALARANLAGFGERATCVRGNFADLQQILAELGVGGVDGILLDLGLSSLQLDGGERGFSFRGSELLDMRMDDRTPETAADLLNKLSRQELADLFYYFGEERQARPIAAMVVAERTRQPFRTTDQLVDTVSRAIPKRFHPRKIHVATRVFQALRIAVNRELDNLVKILAVAGELLKPGGRFCVISFHSLEDRLVKRAFAEDQRFKVITRRPVRPGEEECRKNPRARSAKLRVAERVAEW
ncbi:MAG: 16S rRNA (cytosine(1402)-N(4))-methyltransferase RsmH [Desulfurivibrionaceae bacterium]|nr:16S rRNA (cytosine(1402)-N(4))-methyltransferase RsmH [Desulfobulbales bacterium]MDT8335198.1 16S rRNA (cytosine(1402)-N(4))-methyltransferase RsmH [Desulfurivibrionaceae bacterium]